MQKKIISNHSGFLNSNLSGSVSVSAGIGWVAIALFLGLCFISSSISRYDTRVDCFLNIQEACDEIKQSYIKITGDKNE